MGVINSAVVVEKMEVFPNGVVQVRERTVFTEDGVQVGVSPIHRRVIEPDQVRDEADQLLKDTLPAIQSAARKTAYAEVRAEQQARHAADAEADRLARAARLAEAP